MALICTVLNCLLDVYFIIHRNIMEFHNMSIHPAPSSAAKRQRRPQAPRMAAIIFQRALPVTTPMPNSVATPLKLSLTPLA